MPSRTTYYNLALKEFNKDNKSFVFVRKGTEEYDKVKEIEQRLKEEAKNNDKNDN